MWSHLIMNFSYLTTPSSQFQVKFQDWMCMLKYEEFLFIGPFTSISLSFSWSGSYSVQAPEEFHTTPLLFLSSHCLLWTSSPSSHNLNRLERFSYFSDKCHILLKTHHKTLLFWEEHFKLTLLDVWPFWSWHLPSYRKPRGWWHQATV